MRKHNIYLKKQIIGVLFFVSLLHYLSLYDLCYARKNDEFIEFLSRKIYEDCQGKSINLKRGLIFSKETRENIVDLENYNIDTIKAIITEFTNMEPWNLAYNEGSSIGPGATRDGMAILVCGDNKLDIVINDYFWNGEQVLLPREKIEKSFLRIGDININFIGGISLISISFLCISFVSIKIVIIIFKFVASIMKNTIVFNNFINLCRKIRDRKTYKSSPPKS